MEKNKGITLIALVVTIIVLLIIAGISIATLTGKGGMINQAKEAKNSTEKAENDESKQLADILSEAKEGASYGDATGAQIVKGYKAYDNNGSEIIGTMRNNGALNKTLLAGESYEIPAGYTTGGTVTAKDLESQTQANATAEDIAKDKTAWVNGEKITGIGNNIQVLERATYTSPVINHASTSSFTINLQKNYTEEDNAYFYICSFTHNSKGAPYLNLWWSGGKVIGSTRSGYISNGGGGPDSDGMKVTITYVITKGNLFQE